MQQLCLICPPYPCRHRKLPAPVYIPPLSDADLFRVVLPPTQLSPRAGQRDFIRPDRQLRDAATNYLRLMQGRRCKCRIEDGVVEAACTKHRGALLGRDWRTGQYGIPLRALPTMKEPRGLLTDGGRRALPPAPPRIEEFL